MMAAWCKTDSYTQVTHSNKQLVSEGHSRADGLQSNVGWCIGTRVTEVILPPFLWQSKKSKLCGKDE
jgi:hypothetical protein